MRSCGMHLRAISQEMLKKSILDMNLKITHLKLYRRRVKLMKHPLPLGSNRHIFKCQCVIIIVLHHCNITLTFEYDILIAHKTWRNMPIRQYFFTLLSHYSWQEWRVPLWFCIFIMILHLPLGLWQNRAGFQSNILMALLSHICQL